MLTITRTTPWLPAYKVQAIDPNTGQATVFDSCLLTITTPTGGAVYGPTAGTSIADNNGWHIKEWLDAGSIPAGVYLLTFQATVNEVVQPAETFNLFLNVPTLANKPTINTPGAIAPMTARLDRRLAALLGDTISQAFQNGKVYSAAARAAALTSAILTYSDYRPCLRRFGNANLLNAATAGDTAFLAVGGIFAAGDQLTLDSSGATPEQVTVLSISDDAVELQTLPDAVISLPTLVNLASPLAYNHSAGCQAADNVPGLTLVAGQDSYTLPDDWIQPDHGSFDLAIGAKLSYSKHLGYFDATIGDVNALSGQGISDYGNYAGGFGAIYGLLPVAATDPQGRMVPGASCQSGQTFRFYQSQPARLRLIPAPAANFTLDFDYLGCHTGESVPMRDHTALLEYALYAAKVTRSSAINEKQDTRIGDNIDNVSRNAKVLQTAAETHLREFEKRIINVPYCISG